MNSKDLKKRQSVLIRLLDGPRIIMIFFYSCPIIKIIQLSDQKISNVAIVSNKKMLLTGLGGFFTIFILLVIIIPNIFIKSGLIKFAKEFQYKAFNTGAYVGVYTAAWVIQHLIFNSINLHVAATLLAAFSMIIIMWCLEKILLKK